MRFPLSPTFLMLPLLAVVVAQLVGCASTGGHPGRFPTRQQIEALAASPQVNLAEVPILDVERWRIEAPLTKRLGDDSVAPAGPWEKRVYDLGIRSGAEIRLTASLRCFAGEYARFFARHRSRPSELLHSHLAAACGVVAQDVLPYMIHGTLPAGYPAARLREDWGASIPGALSHALQGGRRLVGVAQSQHEDFAVLVVVGGIESVRLTPFVPVPNDRGRLMIEGHFLRPVESFWATVNQGEYGFAECVADPLTELPRFRVLCSTLPGDRTAWIQLSYVEPGRILGHVALSVLARHEQGDVVEYRAPRAVPLGEAATNQDFRQLVLEGVQRDRARAGIGPVSVDADQSLTATRLGPSYFAAQYGLGEIDEAEQIVLGLMAGWDIDGVIRDSFFTASWAAGTREVGIWLANALAFPTGRRVLLNPDASVLALGPVLEPEGKFSASLVLSYALHDASAHRADAELLFEKVARARERRGLPPARRLEELEARAARAALALQSGSGTPRGVLMDLQTAQLKATGRGTSALVLELTRLDQFTVPDLLLGRGDLEVAITVSHYQPADSPWGRYVVLILVPQPLRSI